MMTPLGTRQCVDEASEGRTSVLMAHLRMRQCVDEAFGGRGNSGNLGGQLFRREALPAQVLDLPPRPHQRVPQVPAKVQRSA